MVFYREANPPRATRTQNYPAEDRVKLPEPVSAYRVLKSANISPEKEQLVHATITELKYEAMKKQIVKIFDETCLTKNSSPPVNVKVEDAFLAIHFKVVAFIVEEDVEHVVKLLEGVMLINMYNKAKENNLKTELRK